MKTLARHGWGSDAHRAGRVELGGQRVLNVIVVCTRAFPVSATPARSQHRHPSEGHRGQDIYAQAGTEAAHATRTRHSDVRTARVERARAELQRALSRSLGLRRIGAEQVQQQEAQIWAIDRQP
jgi:hypothetical protein